MAPLTSEAFVGGEAIETLRRSTMQLTCIAGIPGLPAVNISLSTEAVLPCGVSIVGPVHRDADLLRVARQISDQLQQRKMTHA